MIMYNAEWKTLDRQW